MAPPWPPPPLAGRVTAEHGWCALFVDGDSYEAVPIGAWGLVVAVPKAGAARPVDVVTWEPVSGGGERLLYRPRFAGYVYPGETVELAVARLEREAKG